MYDETFFQDNDPPKRGVNGWQAPQSFSLYCSTYFLTQAKGTIKKPLARGPSYTNPTRDITGVVSAGRQVSTTASYKPIAWTIPFISIHNLTPNLRSMNMKYFWSNLARLGGVAFRSRFCSQDTLVASLDYCRWLKMQFG